MSEVPAGWYDDPEHPDHHRYWDGTQWTDHRAPKVGGGGPDRPGARRTSAWSVVSDTFSLLGRHWREFVVLAVPLLLLSLLGLVLALGAVDAALEPGLQEIIDRVSEPGFDPDDPADDAFLESIEIDIGAGAVVAFVLAVVAFLAATFVAPIAVARYAMGAEQGAPPALGDAFALALRRAPRMFAVALVYALGLIAATIAMIVLAVIVPLTLVLTIPALIVGLLWSVPLVSLATPVVSVGPDGVPTWPTAWGLLRGRWWATAGRLLILWLVVFAVGIGFSVVSGPVTVASFWGGALVNTLAQAAQTVYWQVGGIAVYRWAEGPVDPRLLPSSTP